MSFATGLFLLMALQSCASSGEVTSSFAPISKSASRYVKACVEKTKTPGAAIILFRSSGDPVFLTYGYANIETQKRFTPHTRTTIHSISKTFAGVIAMQMAAESKLDLDAPISQAAPHIHFPQGRERKTTIRHLLTHRSGLPYENEALATGAGNAADMGSLRFVFEPGEAGKRSYSNTAYAVLGEIFETLDGERIDKIVQRRIIARLGMGETWLGSDPYDPTLTRQYMPRRYDLPFNLNTPLKEIDRPLFEHMAAGMTSSLSDLALYGRMFLNEGSLNGQVVLEREWYRKLIEVTAPGVSYDQAQGVRVITLPSGLRLYGHSGSWVGGRTALYMSPELDLGVAAFVNISDRCDAPDLAYKIFAAAHDIAIGRAPAANYDAGKRDVTVIRRVSNAKDYTGAWTNASGKRLVFEADGASLSLKDGQEVSPVEHYFIFGADAFVISDKEPGRYPYDFKRDENGKVIGLAVGPDWYARGSAAVKSVDIQDEAWGDITGYYRNERAGPNGFDIYARNGKLYRRAHWQNGEEALTLAPGSAVSNILSFSFGEEENKNYLDFVLFNGRAIKAIYNGAPFEKSFLVRRIGDQP